MNRDYITVAEYAELRGISVQAVYKALNGRLKEYAAVVELDGKPQKVLKTSALSADERRRYGLTVDRGAAPVPVEPVNQIQPDSINQAKPDLSGAMAELYTAAFDERGRRVADLESRIQEQARTIEALRAELAEAGKRMAEKDKYIQEQGEKLAGLLDAALQLQPGNLLLMGAASRAGVQEAQGATEAATNYEDIPEGAQTVQAEPAAPAAQRRGFWSRVFGK